MANLVLSNDFESSQYDNVLNSASANKKRLIANALADAISNIELPFEISQKAYKVYNIGMKIMEVW